MPLHIHLRGWCVVGGDRGGLRRRPRLERRGADRRAVNLGGDAGDPSGGGGSSADLAAWQTIEIIDVKGVSFTLAELIGAAVLVETFARGARTAGRSSGTRRRPLRPLVTRRRHARSALKRTCRPATARAYAADNGFTDVRFAVMSPELLASFAEAFGTTVANPPSTPKIVITAEGVAGELQTGPTSDEELVEQLRAAA